MANKILYVDCLVALLEAGLPSSEEERERLEDEPSRLARIENENTAKKNIMVELLAMKKDSAARKYLDRCQADLGSYLGGERLSDKKKELVLAAIERADTSDQGFEEDAPALQRKTKAEARKILLSAMKLARNKLSR